MLTFIHRRLKPEDGFTLIELLIAMMILSVAIFALLGGLIASANSLAHQRKRTAATRVATQELEQLRSMSFDDLAVGTEGPYEQTLDERAFQVTRIVQWMDAETHAIVESESEGDVKHVTLTVAWEHKGQPKEHTMQTAIAPDAARKVEGGPDPGDEGPIEIVSTGGYPTNLPVDDTGASIEDFEIDVAVRGLDKGDAVSVVWTNGDGSTNSKTLSSGDGINWTGTIPAGDIVKQVPDGETETTIDFEIIARDFGPPMQEVRGAHTLTLITEEQPTLTFTMTYVDPERIRVRRPQGNSDCGDAPEYCTNLDEIELQARIEWPDGKPFGEGDGSVMVSYQQWDGTPAEVQLNPSDLERNLWVRVIEPGRAKFMVGDDLQFVFNAKTVEEGAAGSEIVPIEVIEVGGRP